MAKKQIKVGVNEGGGPPPGYLWSVLFLTVAEREAKSDLTLPEYLHVVDHIKALASEKNPTKPVTVSSDDLDGVFELRIKGGPLAKKNMRVFYSVEPEPLIILIVGCRQGSGSIAMGTTGTGGGFNFPLLRKEE